MVTINEPIWQIGYFVKGYHGRGVGVNEEVIGDRLEIEISYFDKEGFRLFPDLYVMSGEKAKTFPKKKHKGITLVYIPLSEFEIKKTVEV